MAELIQIPEPPKINPNLKPFIEFLSQLKQLCDTFIQNFTEPDLPRIRKQKDKKKKPRDPEAPKMPKSAFIFYFQDQKDRFLQTYPNMTFQEITKLIADEWKTLSSEQQHRFKEMAEVDRNRYTYQQREYCQTGNRFKFSKFIQKKFLNDEKQERKIKRIIEKVDSVKQPIEEVEDKNDNIEDEEDSFGADIVEEDG